METLKIGNIIHERRLELKMSLEEIATQMGTTKATVSRWENGIIKTLKHPQLYALSKILYLPIDVLLGESEMPATSEIAKEKIIIKKTVDEIDEIEKLRQIHDFAVFITKK